MALSLSGQTSQIKNVIISKIQYLQGLWYSEIEWKILLHHKLYYMRNMKFWLSSANVGGVLSWKIKSINILSEVKYNHWILSSKCPQTLNVPCHVYLEKIQCAVWKLDIGRLMMGMCRSTC